MVASFYFLQNYALFGKRPIVQVLYGVCQDIMNTKATTLADDSAAHEKLQQSGSSNARQKLALQFRIAYKSLLHACSLQHSS